jgi:hypothetical protein
VLDVPEVELDALRPRQRRAAVDLRPPGDPRLHREAPALTLGVLLDLDRDRRPRPDQRHLAAHDVNQVRQLVDREAPQQRADARDPRIVLRDRQPGADRLGVGDHRAQLDHVERVAVLADPPLAIDHVTGRLEPDREHRGREQG